MTLTTRGEFIAAAITAAVVVLACAIVAAAIKMIWL